MNITSDIKPITYLKNRAADVLRQINETHRPIIIQNGEPRVQNGEPRVQNGEPRVNGVRVKLTLSDKPA